MDKLRKMDERHTDLINKLDENQKKQLSHVKALEKEIGILTEEKEFTIDSINRHKEELEELKKALEAKKAEVGVKDDEIAELEA